MSATLSFFTTTTPMFYAEDEPVFYKDYLITLTRDCLGNDKPDPQLIDL
eukprot:CAMPEP_0184058080 /NCGR_PEP_ID=MMETSP0956-20121227/8974_1 /TAXON_ID=627963 /ORGANISM="Aplanochytrium sp, Strain PBS07" /LENGTH=48 /DNA_ID= /DNA_START= /DNA_END= /DNA_ORIENTATION=